MKKIILVLSLIFCALYLRAEFGSRSIVSGGITSESDPVYTSSAPVTYLGKSGDTMNAGAELILSTHSPVNANAAIFMRYTR